MWLVVITERDFHDLQVSFSYPNNKSTSIKYPLPHSLRLKFIIQKQPQPTSNSRMKELILKSVRKSKEGFQ